MSTILYHFDDPDEFSLLGGYTPHEELVTIERVLCKDLSREVRGGDVPSAFLRVALRREVGSADDVRAVLALPLIAIDGRPETLTLDVQGDGRGCQFTVDAGDATGDLFFYRFGRADFAGWRSLHANLLEPVANPEEPEGRTDGRVRPPIQLYRLGISLPDGCTCAEVGLGALAVTGAVRLASPGLT